MDRYVRLAVIGTGRIGKLHVENIVRSIPQAKLIGVADIDHASATEVAGRFGIPLAVADYSELLNRPELEAIVICSATNTHAQIIQDASQAGKHIFCEKPIDFDLSRIDQTLAMVADAGVKLQIGFQRRFDTNFRRLKESMTEGLIGMPHLLRVTSRDPAPPPISYIQVSGGIFLDMMIHDFDMARFLINSKVEEVYATGSVMVDPAIGQAGDIDTALVTLKFANGVIGTIDNSRQAVYGYDQRVEVFGSQGMLQAGNCQTDTVILSNDDAIQRTLPPFFFLERYQQAYQSELQAFIDAILKDKTPLVTGDDGRAPVVIGLTAQRSLVESRPVRPDEIETDILKEMNR